MKVQFGISNLHVGTYTDTNGTVTLGTPYHQEGAVNFSPETNSEQNDFYADNIIYWSGYSGGSIEGDLEFAMFDAGPIRVILYNCSLGNISREYSTITENKEPQTATIPVTCVGDNNTGVTMATFKIGDDGYSTLFTAPTAPAIAP